MLLMGNVITKVFLLSWILYYKKVSGNEAVIKPACLETPAN